MECGKTPEAHDDWHERWRLNTGWRAARAKAQAWLVMGAALMCTYSVLYTVISLVSVTMGKSVRAYRLQEAWMVTRFTIPVMAACIIGAWVWMLIGAQRTACRRKAFWIAGSVVIMLAAIPLVLGSLGVAWALVPEWADDLETFFEMVAERDWILIPVSETDLPFLLLAMGVTAWIAAARQTLPNQRRKIRAAGVACIILGVFQRTQSMLVYALVTMYSLSSTQVWWAGWPLACTVELLAAGSMLLLACWMAAECRRMRPQAHQQPPQLSELALRMLVIVPVAMLFVSAAMWSFPIADVISTQQYERMASSTAIRWTFTIMMACAWVVPFAWATDRRWWKAVLIGSAGAVASVSLGSWVG